MRISVTHSTVYRYDSPVFLDPHTIRLRPRDDGAQRLCSYTLEISPPPAGKAECLDQDGNVVVESWFEAPVTELAVRSMFTVEMLRDNPFAFLVRRGMPELPPAYSDGVSEALGRYRRDAGIAETVRSFAAAVAAGAGERTLEFLTALNREIFEDFAYVTRDLGAPNPPEVTLAERQGTCRDFALLFAAACRTVGLAARFVSGYDCGAARPERSEMHAWAEVYIEGGGWRGYDPSSGLAVSTGHVAVAAAAAPALAAPITGSYRGPARSAMEFAISIQAG
jgi:transglutaminase-like putative cysteine protease